ncbi:MAG TPA: toluene hydroxylase, partial [Rhodopila sp.]|nr:toluene hydroxylase [Rhodopila sp.]
PDWNEFRDPDQLTYRQYVTIQDASETHIDATLHEFDRLGRSAIAPDFLQSCLTPSRFLAHGLQMMSAYLQQLAPSSYIGNCAAFQAADQLRRLQRVAYRTKQLAVACPERGFGQKERPAWLESPAWQGFRKAVEHLLVTFDWDDAFVGLNLVVKPLADEITLRQFAAVARLLGADLDALIADTLFLDAERSRRWTIALCRFAIAENAANTEHVFGLLARWRPLADEILATGSDLLSAFVPDPAAAGQIATTAFNAWRDVLAEAGLPPMPHHPSADQR